MTTGTDFDESDTDAGKMVSTAKLHMERRKRRQRFIRIWTLVGLFFLISILGMIWLLFRADQIATHLNRGVQLVSEIQLKIVEGDVNGARPIIEDLERSTTLANAAGTDPLWRAAGHIPILGNNFSAITEVTVSADDVVKRALLPLFETLGTLRPESLTPIDGRINLAPIEAASPRLSTAASTVELSYDRLSSIETSALLPQVAEPLEEASDRLHEASEALGGAAAVAEILPAMLGTDETRNYLLLIQNPAEVRATGGIAGALAVITATDGHIELTDQGSATEMGRFDPPIAVDATQTNIYSTRIGRFMQSVNLTPDFPTAARTGATMWETYKKSVAIDGVIALDPVVLGHILRATGPVDLSLEDPLMAEAVRNSGLPTSLTEENVVRTLLSDVYSAIEEPAQQDAYFAAVASDVFNALSSGTGDSTGLLLSLTRSADEGRLYVWSADEEEQAIIAASTLAGSVTGAQSGGAAFGAYFNDGTGAKMDYYVRRNVQLERSCTPEGYLQYTLTATLTNTAPVDAAQSLPAYVTGGGAFGVPPGTVQTNFVAYGPDQSQLQTARVNGEPTPLGSHRHGARPVGVMTSRLDPGETVTVEIDFTNVVQRSEPSLDVTPTIQPLSEVVLPLKGDTTCG